MVSRWREERARGESNDAAVITAISTAGHAVLTSGITVAISLVSLVVAIVPFFGIQLGSPDSDALSHSGVAHDALQTLRAGGVDTGAITPIPLLVKPGTDARAFADAAERVVGVRMATALPPGKGEVTAVIITPDRETVDNTSVTGRPADLSSTGRPSQKRTR